MNEDNKSMTALVSLFSRAYHSENNDVKIFDDYIASSLLSKEEYKAISDNMRKGIGFFNPNYKGDKPLRWIVDNQLSPSTLGRAAFAEHHLENAVRIGAQQYLILAAGYDTFAYRQPKYGTNLNIFEIDLNDTQEDKIKRVTKNFELPGNLTYISADLSMKKWIQSLVDCKNYDKRKISFSTLLGITYYLSRDSFIFLLSEFMKIIPRGSSIVFDYPDENIKGTDKQVMLAKEAGEEMLSGYSYKEIEKLLEESGFLIYEHLVPDQITEQYFNNYNKANPKYKMQALNNVNYCLAVKNN